MQNPSAIRTRPRRAAAAVQTRELPLTFIFLVIVCACVVAAGFFIAARQHFNSIDYGIRNSKLRDQLQNLETEKRRLILAREVALSPLSMRKAAREIGLRESTDASYVVAVQAKAAAPKAETVVAEKAKVSESVEKPTVTPAVVKTAMSAPSGHKQSGEVRSRVAETGRSKKEKTEVAALIKFR